MHRNARLSQKIEGVLPMKRISVFVLMSLVLSFAWFSIAKADDKTSTPVIQPILETKSVVVTPTVGYQIHKEDVLRITVWGEPNFSGEQVVDPAGCINVSSLGSLKVEGCTATEVADKIKTGIAPWVRNAKIQVELSQIYKPKVYVLGTGINRPGVFEFKTGDRVMEAIALAGSFSDLADLANARLTHNGSKTEIKINLEKLFHEGDMSQNLDLHDGDALFVPEDTLGKYAVVGEVLHQSQYRLKKNVTVMDAISNAGGPTSRGALKSTYVLRKGPKGPERIHVDMEKFEKKADMAQNIELMPGDVVYVPETNKLDWDKISRNVSTIVNTTWLLRGIGF